jgi:hypothetical protein
MKNAQITFSRSSFPSWLVNAIGKVPDRRRRLITSTRASIATKIPATAAPAAAATTPLVAVALVGADSSEVEGKADDEDVLLKPLVETVVVLSVVAGLFVNVAV